MIALTMSPSWRHLHYVDNVFQTEPREIRRGETVPALIGHCSRYMSDRALADDFLTVVVPLARTDEDADLLRRYRRARMRAPGFARQSDESNNHRRIPAELLAALTEGAPSRLIRQSRCPVCGGGFTATRADARYCSGKCRTRNARATRTAG